ncbi:MAG TPA: helix-turn-helix domain-containing protein [Ktedonobacterales bacterium]|nr:helix-turn-helix domain-containing protein [Ktedonobacterales bacterium]
MSIVFEDRPSDSPLVERIWQSRCEHAGSFLSVALSRWQLVAWNAHGKTYFTVRGPETKATTMHCPVHEEYVGILLTPGTFMPHLPSGNLVDNTLTLPDATSKTFWLNGSDWQFPGYENADTFVARLVREGLLVREPVVDDALQGHVRALSARTIERRFLRATGLTQGAVRQIERARYAITLLQQGTSILDTVVQAGYYDQPHLTRSLRYFVGQTPTQISGNSTGEQLSFLYKTPPACCVHNELVG